MATRTKTEDQQPKFVEEKLEGKRRVLKTDVSQVKPGDIVLVTHYAKVISKEYGIPYRGQHSLNVENLDGGMTFGIQGDNLIENLATANQALEEVLVTKTQAAELLVTLYGVPFTVVFDKQPDKAGNVEERTLRGRLVAPEPLLGRSHVEDLEQPVNKRLRLVDHRTLKSICVNGIRYVVKGK